MKKILFLMSIIGLVYAIPNYKTGVGYFHFQKICVDNIIYLYNGYRLSVYINPKTLKPMNCR